MAHSVRLHLPHRHLPHAGVAEHHVDTHQTLAWVTFALGVVALVTAGAGLASGRWAVHVAAIVMGIPGLLVGAWSQTVSDSTNQRWFTVIGLVAAGVAVWISFPGTHIG